MEYHEIANIFPMMTDAEFEQLKDDIVLNGQLDPYSIGELQRFNAVAAQSDF